jgi:hypothetical protein
VIFGANRAVTCHIKTQRLRGREFQADVDAFVHRRSNNV